MPTTTNFGWTTPADTDLVKDGAAAIRTLGSNIDTSLVDLKGGTSGQYLKKNSNTDLDYIWGDVSAGADYQLLNAGGTTLSGAATRTVSGISGKSSLYIYIEGASSASGSSDFNLRLNSDSGSNYKFFGISLANNNDVVARISSTSSTSVTLANIGNAGGIANILIKIDGTNATGIKAINSIGYGDDTNGQSRVLNAIYTGTSAISSVSLISSVGNWDAGTLYVYGG